MTYISVKCPLCEHEFKQEKRLYSHLSLLHHIQDIEKFYVDTYLNSLSPTCMCSSTCTFKLKWSGWKSGYASKYTRGHNARIDSKFKSDFIRKKGTKPWNVGKTKKTDDRIALSADKISKTIHERSDDLIKWKFTEPERFKASKKKMATARKKLFNEGILHSWNEGKTKLTDARIAGIASKISENYQNREAGRRMSSDELLQRMLNLSGIMLLSDPNEYRSRYHTILSFKCLTCNSEFQKTFGGLERTPVCNVCHPHASKAQLEIYEYVRSLDASAVLCDRTLITPKEIDILVPDKLAIEYDGLWWHSEKFAGQNDATKKFELVHDKKISALRVYSDEWAQKPDIIKSMIKHRLSLDIKSIGARKCKVISLNPAQRRTFIDDNHIDGDVKSTASWALEYDGEIVAALSIRKPFHKVYNELFEVGRYCTSKDIKVPGALSRLTKEALKYAKDHNKKGLLSYVDERLGFGAGYIASGYEQIGRTKPRFWWTDFSNRFNRFTVKADRSNGLSEDDVANMSGMTRIWGCCNRIFGINV